MSGRRWLALAIAGVAFLLIAGRLIAAFLVDRAWYVSLGADELWRSKLLHTLAIKGAAWMFATAYVYANLYAVRRSVVSVVLPRRVGDLEIGEELPARVLTMAAALGAVVTGAALALASPGWLPLARARYGVPFGESDAAFERDIGFYVNWLPLEHAVYEWSLVCTAVVIALVLLLYALTPSLRWERGRLKVTGYVRRHLTILGAVVLAILAWNHRLDAFGLLIHGSGIDGAFTYADRHVNVSTDLLLAFLTFSAAIAVVATGWVGQIRLAFGIVTVVLVTSLLLRSVLPSVAERLAGPESPAAREGPFRATRVAYTRRAYAVNRIVNGEPPPISSLMEVASRAPAWEPVPLRRALARSGAGVIVADFGWRMQNGELHAFAIDAPGESADTSSADPWRLLDVRLAPATAGGELPPNPAPTDRSELPVPPVYFHPGALGPLVVDDPEGAVIGAPFDSFLARLAHAWSQQNFRLLRGAAPSATHRMLVRRDVHERVGAIVPAFRLGERVVPLVVGDTIWWAVDIYSASDRYPLSEHLTVAGDRISYLRHAGLGLVHAFTGATVIVSAPEDRLDPMARTWVRRFPTFFQPHDSLPAEIARQLPAPVDAIQAQALQFARFGSRDESSSGRRVAGSGADSIVGSALVPPLAGATPGMQPIHTIPVVDADDRLRGVVVAEANGLRDPYWVPLEAYDVRWTNSLARLRRWSDSSTARGEARMVRGAVRVVPVAGRAVLVQTSYRWRTDAPPTIAMVAVLDRGIVLPLEAVAMANADSSPVSVGEMSDGRFGAEVARLYERMRDAMRRGDWRAFGAAYDSLGAVVRQRPRAP